MRTKLIIAMACLMLCGCATTEIDRINDNIDRIQGDVTAVAESIESGDPVDTAKGVWDATRLWNPYWGFGAAGFMVLEMFRKRKKEVA